MNINKEQTIATIVRENYRAAEVFSKHGIDFCCGGKISLEKVCEKGGLDINVISQELNYTLNPSEDDKDFGSWRNEKLIKYIVDFHHSYVEESVPYLSQLLNKIATVHGDNHPELIEVRDIYDEATDALYDHMKKEEMILFPAIQSMEIAKENNGDLPPLAFGSINNPIGMMEHDHDFEGDAFKKIASLTNNFTPPADACNTYTVAFYKLKEFVDDLHQHIHLENNILFENAKSLESQLQLS